MATIWGDLWRLADQMGADRIEDFNLALPPPSTIEIEDGQLAEGLEIDLEDLDEPISVGGLLSYKGRQVLVYIPDQGGSLAGVLKRPETGKKFHVSHCSTLSSMESKNKNHRYVATNDTSGLFNLRNWSGSEQAKGELTVCRNCLNHLNYKDYSGRHDLRNHIFKIFNLIEFFSTYSSLFKYKYAKHSKSGRGYSLYQVSELASDWTVVSEERSCGNCNVTLPNNVELVSSESNQLEGSSTILCVDCHRKKNWRSAEPVLVSEMQSITKARRDQGLLEEVNTWAEAYELVDPSFRGLLKIFERQSRTVPTIGHPLTNFDGVVLDVEIALAWEETKRGVVANVTEKAECESLGWKVETLTEAMISCREDG